MDQDKTVGHLRRVSKGVVSEVTVDVTGIAPCGKVVKDVLGRIDSSESLSVRIKRTESQLQVHSFRRAA